MRRRGLEYKEIFAALQEVNHTRVSPPLEEIELASIAESVMRYKPQDNAFNSPTTPQTEEKNDSENLSIPALPEIALYGLAGEIVRTIEPHTEADNGALLIQLLTGFGCLIGKTAHFRAEADYHFTKLFAVIAFNT